LNSGYAGAQAGLAGAANTYSQINQNRIAANSSSNSLWGGLGSAAGMLGPPASNSGVNQFTVVNEIA
jgi:hypothetical protein